MDMGKRLNTARQIKREVIRGRTMEAWFHSSDVDRSACVRIFEDDHKVATFNYVTGTRVIDVLQDVNNFFEALK